MNFPLDIFLPENKLYGFAIWQLLGALTDKSTEHVAYIDNQPQAKDFDADKPQLITFSWSDDEDALPTDFYEYSVKVQITPSTEFNAQPTTLIKSERICDWDDDPLISEVSYCLPLAQVLQLIPRIKDFGKEIFPCLPVHSSTDYVVTHRPPD